jgi:DNA-binding PadR family transcriptional regulator
MEGKLLLLGLLRGNEMHGYQLNEFIDSHLTAMVDLKRPTAYRLLNKMADDGWITYREEREGKRPPRRVFAITPKGEAAFQRMLRENLANFKPVMSPGNVGLLFLHVIPRDEALILLQKRRANVARVLEQSRAHDMHDAGALYALSHQIHHLEAELKWMHEVIARLDVAQA